VGRFLRHGVVLIAAGSIQDRRVSYRRKEKGQTDTLPHQIPCLAYALRAIILI